MPTLPGRYYAPLAAAFIRGSLPAPTGQRALWECALEALGEEELAVLLDIGQAAGLRLEKFKRSLPLPRVKAVLGVLAGFHPHSLLDIGSGRGAFLWPLLDAWPRLPVTAVDAGPLRARDLGALQAGGLANLRGLRMDATALAFADRTFAVVTALEVLEHIPDWQRACAESRARGGAGGNHLRAIQARQQCRASAPAGVCAPVGLPHPSRCAARAAARCAESSHRYRQGERMSENLLYKYPRTHHLEGSNQQPGDEDLERIPFAQIRGRHVVVEEKLDGSNSGLSLSPDCRLQFQSRGHYLAGGGRSCTSPRSNSMVTLSLTCLSHCSVRVMCCMGSGFMPNTPSSTIASRIISLNSTSWTRTAGNFSTLRAGTPCWRRCARCSPRCRCSTPVCWSNTGNWWACRSFDREQPRGGRLPGRLRRRVRGSACPARLQRRQTDLSGQMEGLYIKVEHGGVATERYKWVRHSSCRWVFDAHSHWQDRPIVRNRVREPETPYDGPKKSFSAEKQSWLHGHASVQGIFSALACRRRCMETHTRMTCAALEELSGRQRLARVGCAKGAALGGTAARYRASPRRDERGRREDHFAAPRHNRRAPGTAALLELGLPPALRERACALIPASRTTAARLCRIIPLRGGHPRKLEDRQRADVLAGARGPGRAQRGRPPGGRGGARPLAAGMSRAKVLGDAFCLCLTACARAIFPRPPQCPVRVALSRRHPARAHACRPAGVRENHLGGAACNGRPIVELHPDSAKSWAFLHRRARRRHPRGRHPPSRAPGRRRGLPLRRRQPAPALRRRSTSSSTTAATSPCATSNHRLRPSTAMPPAPTRCPPE